MRTLNLDGIEIGVFEGESNDNLLPQPDIVIIGYAQGLKANFDDVKSANEGGVAEVVATSSVFTCPVFGGVKTTYKGYKSISVAVATFGKIVDIVDRTINVRGDEFVATDKIKIYKTAKCSAALLIDTDILLAKNWERVSTLSDFIIGIALDISDEEAALLVSLSELYKIGYALVATNRLEWKD